MNELPPRPQLEAELTKTEQLIAELSQMGVTTLPPELLEKRRQLRHALQLDDDASPPEPDTRSESGATRITGTQMGGSTFTGETEAGNDIVGRNKITVYAESGARVVIGDDEEVPLTNIERESALGQYLTHLIAHNRYLQLQGIRSGGRLVHIELDNIYITLRATRKRTVKAEQTWVLHAANAAPGERRRRAAGLAGDEMRTETVTVTVNEALQAHRRLVVLGDPGSGKTTLLRYLALVYARSMAHQPALVAEKLGLDDAGHLPVLLFLRQIGAFLRDKPDRGIDGHKLLLEFLHQSLANQRIDVPLDFFDTFLQRGQAIILLDGLDEVADPELRRRVARLVEQFGRAYPACRYVVTSRIVGYVGAARLGENFRTTTVRDFTLSDIRTFLSHWHHLVAAGQMGLGESAQTYARNQTAQLMRAVEGNERIRELAINPLMLTVIALVHRDRVKLPDRRAELYAEAIDVLLGKWDEARGVKEERAILPDRPFDTGDRRLMLQSVAHYMHEQQIKEIEADDLRRLLYRLFADMVGEGRAAERAVSRFLRIIQERTGLLVARGEGVFAFSHLTFQEYLAALALLAEEAYTARVLQHSGDSWWREAILLAVGELSLSSKQRTTNLIRAIADKEAEPEPYHNLVLAAECLRDAGRTRVVGALEKEIQTRLRADIELDIAVEIARQAPQSGWERLQRNVRGQQFDADAIKAELVERKIAAATALGRLRGLTGQGYWSKPYGEPEWVEIPAGEFWMGSDHTITWDNKFIQELLDSEKPRHKVYLDAFLMAKTPVTNAQYRLFVAATEHEPPPHWEEGKVPRGLENHPVVTVSWHDALAYCRWLSDMTGQAIALPTEAEWEKAARGTDGRRYPWGDAFDPARCNNSRLGIESTTPVGIFPAGSSPYGLLDMAGNVWEWTGSLYAAYDREKWDEKKEIVWISEIYGSPYEKDDGREDLTAGDEWTRIVKGGSWYDARPQDTLRCSFRYWHDPYLRDDDYGFRVCVRPQP